MILFISNLFLFILSLFLLFKYKDDAVIFNLSVGVCGATFLTILQSFIFNIKDIKILWYAYIKHCNSEVRFSMAYLYKIKYKSKYLLIKSDRFQNVYQPVGGVYKKLPESKKIFEKLKIKDDKNLPIDDDSYADLRVRVPNTSIRLFLKWFYSQEDREVSHWREFCEELIRKDILDIKIFPHFQYRKLRTDKVEFVWSEHHQCYEYKLFDIIEPEFKPLQLEMIKSLYEGNDSENYKWVDESLILSLGHDDKTGTTPFRIGDQTKYILI